MATKKKVITLRIQPQYCFVEMKNALQLVGKLKGSDVKKGIVKGTYLYVYQTIQVQMILRANKGISTVQIVGITDDLIGTGGNKAIKKIETYLESKVPEYQIDYDIDKAFAGIIKGEVSINEEVLNGALTQRSTSFKVNFGLALCALNRKEEKKALTYINDAIRTKKDKESKINTRKKIASELWKLKHFNLASEVYSVIGQNTKATRNEQLFFLLLLLNSGNFGKLFIELVKSYPSNSDYAILIAKDPGVLPNRKKEFLAKTPALIKGFRKKVIFNISPPSISYLLIKEKREIPLKYREALGRYYKSKNISITEFISIYKLIKSQLISAEKQSIAVLREDKTSFFKEFTKESEKLLVLNQVVSLLKNKKAINDGVKLTLRCANKLESSKSFRELFENIKEAEKCNNSLRQLITITEGYLVIVIEDFLKKDKAKKAKEIISVFEKVYGRLPNKNKVYNSKILKIEEGNKRILKIALLIITSIVLAVLIGFTIFSFNKNNISSDDIGYKEEFDSDKKMKIVKYWGSRYSGKVSKTQGEEYSEFEIKDGLKNGLALIKVNGVKTELLTYKDGSKHGRHILFNSEDTTEYKEFKNGLLHGKSIIFEGKDTVAYDEYKEGLKNGWSYSYTNEKIERVWMKDGKKNGPFIMSISSFYNGIRTESEVQRGNYLADKKSGKWIWQIEDIIEETYKDGILDGPYRIIEMADKDEVGNYKKGKKEGLVEIYSSCCGPVHLVEEQNFVNGLRHGVNRLYIEASKQTQGDSYQKYDSSYYQVNEFYWKGTKMLDFNEYNSFQNEQQQYFNIDSLQPFRQVKKPRIMIIPSHKWCDKNGFTKLQNSQVVSDYNLAYENNNELENVISNIEKIAINKGYHVINLIEIINGFQEFQENLESFEELSEINNMEYYNQSDVVVFFDYTVDNFDNELTVSFTLEGVASKTNQTTAVISRISTPVKGIPLPVIIEREILLIIDNFNAQMKKYAENIATDEPSG